MNTRIPTVLLLALMSFAAAAQEAPTSQWKRTSQSLQSLVGKGYNIVSVRSEPDVERFFLQKGNSVYKCDEAHFNDVRAKTSGALFACWELVSPYVLSLPPKKPGS